MKAGYSAAVITPRVPVRLCGYGIYLERFADSVLDDLYVRGVVLDESGDVYALFTYDLVGFSTGFSGRLSECIASVIGTTPDRITVVCTHTHSGPPTAELRGMEGYDPSYLHRLIDQTKTVAARALENMTDTDFGCASTTIEEIGFNRIEGSFDGIDPTLAVCAFLPVSGGASNPETAPASEAVLRVRDTPIVLVNYSCHAVTLGVNHSVSADFPGRIVSHLEAGGVRALFLQGFCGNIDPEVNLEDWGSGVESDIDAYGGRIASAVLDLTDTIHKNPADRTARGIVVETTSLDLSLDLESPHEIHENRVRRNYGQFGEDALGRFLESWRTDRDEAAAKGEGTVVLPVQKVTLGNIRMICVGGELFSTFGLMLHDRYPDLLAVGYANGVVGYLPDEAAYRNDDDYAAYLAPLFYGPAPFVPGTPGMLRTFLVDVLDDGSNNEPKDRRNLNE